MGDISEAVLQVVRCRDAILKRRTEGEGEGRVQERKRSRKKMEANRLLREEYLALLTPYHDQKGRGGKSPGGLGKRTKALQQLVVLHGLPKESSRDQQGSGSGRRGSFGLPGEAVELCSLRGLIWKVLLGAVHVDAMLYMKLVEQGASWKDSLIKQDTFRTFKSDKEFQRRVPEAKLSRVNNAFVRLNFPEQELILQPLDAKSMREPHHQRTSSGTESLKQLGDQGGYVQGMTILCGPLLFVMPEVDAFFAFHTLLTRHMPRYITPTLDGVHAGCALVDRVLQIVDPTLFAYLERKSISAKIYAFPLLMSLHACIPPLEEALKVWDVLFSYGVHLEVLLAVAQVILQRDLLLVDPAPQRVLNPRYLPPLDAEIIVSAAFCLMPHIPQSLLDEVARHPIVSEREAEELGEHAAREWH